MPLGFLSGIICDNVSVPFDRRRPAPLVLAAHRCRRNLRHREGRRRLPQGGVHLNRRHTFTLLRKGGGSTNTGTTPEEGMGSNPAGSMEPVRNLFGAYSLFGHWTLDLLAPAWGDACVRVVAGRGAADFPKEVFPNLATTHPLNFFCMGEGSFSSSCRHRNNPGWELLDGSWGRPHS